MTEEYKLEIKVKNNLILSKLKQKGYDSIPKFCKDHDICYTSISKFINLSQSPLSAKNGDWRPVILKFCDALQCSPDQIFTEQQKHCTGVTRREVLISEAEIKNYLEHISNDQYLLPLEDQIDKEKLENKLENKMNEVLDTLTQIEKKVLHMRFGINMNTDHTLEQTGKEIGVSKERIRQIEDNALRKLRHPMRSEMLKEFL